MIQITPFLEKEEITMHANKVASENKHLHKGKIL
jgi:hypothetical protein